MKYCKYCDKNKENDQFRYKQGRCNTCEANRDRLRRGKITEHFKHEPYRIPTIHSYSFKAKPKQTVWPYEKDKNNRIITTILCECKECGIKYYSTPNRVFCSFQCGKRNVARIARAKRRAVIKKAFVDRIDPLIVFQKYDWQCAICHTHTPPLLLGKHKPNSPELDHIIPISRGGLHAYNNVQLLCRSCNGIKSDKLDFKSIQHG